MATAPRILRWRASPLLAAMAAALTLAALPGASSGASAASQCAASPSWGTNRPALATQVIALINAYRTGKGLPRLSISAPLTASSRWKSLHMAGYGYFAHDDPAPPVGRSAFERAKSCGYRSGTWGENIAWGYASARSVVDGWLGSPGHRANIDNPGYTSTGVGVAANRAGRLYWTQSFGNDVPSGRPAPASTSQSRSAAPIAGTRARITHERSAARLLASVSFVRLPTGEPLTTASVRCRARVAGRPLVVLRHVFQAGAARCAWQIPAWARGKQLTGSVTVRVGRTAATRTFMRPL